MRVTVRLDDDIWKAAQDLAQRQGRSTDAVLSELARQGLAARETASEPPATRPAPDFPIFEVPEGTPPLTSDMVRRAMEED